jgi:hypothetical protein
VLACLPAAQPRFGALVVDATYCALNGCATRYQGSKVGLLWLIWVPEGSPIRQKMALTSQSLPVKHALGVSNVVEVQANAPEDAAIAAVAAKLDWLYLAQ